MTNHPIGHALTKLGEWATHPAAFGLALLYAAAWQLFDRESFDFHGATELIVLIMTLFIVRLSIGPPRNSELVFRVCSDTRTLSLWEYGDVGVARKYGCLPLTPL